MKNYTIRARILVSFAVVLGVMLVMGGIAYTQLAHIEEHRAARTRGRTVPDDCGWLQLNASLVGVERFLNPTSRIIGLLLPSTV